MTDMPAQPLDYLACRNHERFEQWTTKRLLGTTYPDGRTLAAQLAWRRVLALGWWRRRRPVAGLLTFVTATSSLQTGEATWAEK